MNQPNSRASRPSRASQPAIRLHPVIRRYFRDAILAHPQLVLELHRYKLHHPTNRRPSSSTSRRHLAKYSIQRFCEQNL